MTELWLLPPLACEIGLDAALVLRHVHQLAALEEHRNGIVREMSDWRADFPFWTEPEVRDVFGTLKEIGLLGMKRPARTAGPYVVHLTEEGRLAIATALERTTRAVAA